MKFITAPNSVEAMRRLNVDMCIEGDLTEVKLSDVEFNSLCSNGLFDTLNDILGLIIEEYEDEVIPITKLEKGYEIVKQFALSTKHDNQLMHSISEIFEVAIKNKTAVYMFF